MFWNKSPLEKELHKLDKLEQKYLQKKLTNTDSKLNQMLEDKVPDTLQATLDSAFSKAFYMIFEKGTGIIEKTFKKEDLIEDYKINEYAVSIKRNRKSLKTFSKKASSLGSTNLLMSGVSGVGLGLLGIGLPDIALFTGLLLKSVYETSLNYGFDYESEEERIFILMIIQGALSYGDEFARINTLINEFVEEGTFLFEIDFEKSIEECANSLSKELLYMKFLQGFPVIGAIGGAYDAIYMNRVVEYAKLKYYRRFLNGLE